VRIRRAAALATAATAATAAVAVAGGPRAAAGPTGSLVATPGAVTPGATVALDASSFQPGLAPIADYAWDFDGDGVNDRTTTTARVTTTYATVGTFSARVTVSDTAGGTGSATTSVTVRAVIAKPTAKVPAKGSKGRVTVSLTCDVKCAADASLTLTKATTKALLHKSRVTQSRAFAPGTGTLTLRLSKATIAAMRRRHATTADATVRLTVLDEAGARRTISRTVTISR
jgi:PKD repeat protein